MVDERRNPVRSIRRLPCSINMWNATMLLLMNICLRLKSLKRNTYHYRNHSLSKQRLPKYQRLNQYVRSNRVRKMLFIDKKILLLRNATNLKLLVCLLQDQRRAPELLWMSWANIIPLPSWFCWERGRRALKSYILAKMASNRTIRTLSVTFWSQSEVFNAYNV